MHGIHIRIHDLTSYNVHNETDFTLPEIEFPGRVSTQKEAKDHLPSNNFVRGIPSVVSFIAADHSKSLKPLYWVVVSNIWLFSLLLGEVIQVD